MSAVINPLVSLHNERSGCSNTISLFSADWFRGAVGGWGISQVLYLVAAGLVFAASRAMSSVAAGEAGESQAGTVWRRPAAALVDYLIFATVFGAVVWVAWPLIDVSLSVRMGAGLLERAEWDMFRGSVRPAELATLAGLFLYFWVQHALWGRTLGKRLLGIRVIAAHTGGRLGVGRAVLRTLTFPLLVLVPDVGLWCLLVSGLWMLLDAEGRVLHDRFLGAAVVRDRVRDAQPQV
ncbi:RDD family protein [Sinosporangium siamense]|uniref:RDD family protein n=1 Tax=Sinosporangium siamense TaxID=1367973 RepID=UPI00195200C1|nr:RDD family protein [Sinosporangium siamense]